MRNNPTPASKPSTYNSLTHQFAPELTLKPQHKKELTEEVSALLQLLEKLVEELKMKGKEANFTPDITDILNCLDTLEKLIGHKPIFFHLKEKLNKILSEIMPIVDHKLDKKDEEKLENWAQKIALIQTLPTPFSMTPEPKPSHKQDDLEEANQEARKREGDERDKGPVPRYTQF